MASKALVGQVVAAKKREEAQFTPGPWLVRQRPDWTGTFDVTAAGSGPTAVAIVGEGNARLISRAPCLLAVLEDMFAAGSVALGQLPDDALGLRMFAETLDEARRLIAEARGAALSKAVSR